MTDSLFPSQESPNENHRRYTGTSIAILILAVLLVLWAGFDRSASPMDEGYVVLYPELVLHGRLPYRDFETFYAPANLYVLAGADALFGVRIEVERAVGLLYRLLLLTGLFLLIRRWNLPAAILGVVLALSVLLLSGLTAYAWLGGMACVLWSMLFLAGPPTRWRAVIAGLLAGGAILYRQDLALDVLISATPLLLLLPSALRWRYLLGAVLALLPLAILTLAAGFQATLDNLLIYPVFIGGPGRRLPLSFIPRPIFSLVVLHLAACLVNVLAGTIACLRHRQSPSARLFLAATLLSLGLTHQTIQRADETHVICTAFFSLALLPTAFCVLYQCLRDPKTSLPAGLAWGMPVALLLLVWWMVPVLPSRLSAALTHQFNPEARSAPTVTMRDRHFPRAGTNKQSQQVVDWLAEHSQPGQRLFVGNGDMRFTSYNDTFFYHLLPWLNPASYFLEFNPLSANRPNSRLARDVASADWLILDRSWDHWEEPNSSKQPGSNEPNEIVRAQFELQVVYDPLAIFRRRPAAETTSASSPAIPR
jgi:hypothetical protein